jgi:hypothetical protein
MHLAENNNKHEQFEMELIGHYVIPYLSNKCDIKFII